MWELTGALDSNSSKGVLEVVEKLNKIYGTTVIIITHNEDIAKMADRIIHIRNGAITSNSLNTNKLSIKDIEL